MLLRFQQICDRVGVELDATALAEALWLTQFNLVQQPSSDTPATTFASTDQSIKQVDSTGASSASSDNSPEFAKPTYAQDDAVTEGLPAVEVLLPAASPLPNTPALGRALRLL